MRLRKLSMDRFGHFTGRQFDFGEAGEKPDFHIIYGPNEAGKTTTMEAALRLFYGFPNREGYAFKHQRSNLQVSGQLEIDGDLRWFTRLPTRSGALVDEAGAPLPETAISALLAGLSEEDYRHLLCLDDETIERGGEEIAQARGDIGRLLFSAAAGVADLSTVLEKVREEADEIWRKRASKTRIAILKRELAQLEKDIRERDVSASAWRSLKKELADARKAEGEARTARDGLLENAARIAARRHALPMLAEIEALADRIAPFASFPERLDFEPESLVTLLAEESRTRADIERLTTEIEEASVARDGLSRAPELAALTETLDALDDLRARDVTAGLDLERRRANVLEAESAMLRAARDLGADETTDPRSLVLTPAQIASLERARDELRSAEQTLLSETREIEDLAARFEHAEAAHEAAAAKIPAACGIGEILARHDVERLVPLIARAEQAIDAAAADERLAREGLTVGAVRFETLPDCPTSPLKAQDWAEAHAELTRQIAQAEEALSQHREDLAARRAQAAQLASDTSLVSDGEANTLKTERDRLWQRHRAELNDGSAQTFEHALHALDAAMQSRVLQARDLGQLRQIEQAGAELQARAGQAEARLTALREKQAALEGTVNDAAASAGLPRPLSPAEWLDWVKRHEAAAEASARTARLRETHRPTLARAAHLLDALLPHLNLENPDLDSALAAARTLAEAESEAIAAAAQAHEARRTIDEELRRRSKRQEAAKEKATQAKAAWRDLVRDLLSNAVNEESLLATLDPLRALRDGEEKRADAAQRVATMEADQALFESRVTALAATHDLPVAETAAATFSLLRERSEAARAAETRAAELSANLDRASARLTEKEKRLKDIDREVEVMGRIFPEDAPVDTLDALRRTATQAQQVIAERQEKARLERTVLSELGLESMKCARDMLQGVTAAALEAEAESLKADATEAERQLTATTEKRVTAEQALLRVTGDADIAAMTERKATLELELEEAARDHLELSLGYRLADEAIRRYRDTHRSGMMAATESCFSTLTQGAYERLTTQPDGNDETLLAVARDGTVKRVAELSKGTRFQLYLALRAAAHEQLIAQGTRLPFFCDDIFETFDENRTSAACRVMEQIGRRGQAIYLTHHRHVIDLAQKVCDAPPRVHEI